MTKEEAKKIVLHYAEQRYEELIDEIERGPEGIEVYLQPKADKLIDAILIMGNKK